MLNLQDHPICFEWFKDSIPSLPRHLIVCARGDYGNLIVKLAMISLVYMRQLSVDTHIDVARD